MTTIAKDLLGCCASPAWAEAVAREWPYPDLAALLARGETVWRALPAAEWRAALAAHPRIGEPPAEDSQERREQAGAELADSVVLAAIVAGNRDYEARFGMTYVVRAAGRDAAEMLQLLETRLRSSPGDELIEAAAQQWEITALRLGLLWRQLTEAGS